MHARAAMLLSNGAHLGAAICLLACLEHAAILGDGRVRGHPSKLLVSGGTIVMRIDEGDKKIR